MKVKSFLKFAAVVLMIGSLSVPVGAVTQKSSSRSKTQTTAKRKSSQGSAIKVTAGEIHEYGDGLTTRDYTARKGESYITIEYPIAGPAELVGALRALIAEEVYIDNGKGSTVNYAFKSGETPESFLQKALQPYKSRGSMGMEGETIQQKISVKYNNNDVITLNDNGYAYSGGVHGMPWDRSTSILKADGSRLTYDLLPAFSVMKPHIEDGLAKEFDVPVSQLEDAIQGGEIQSFPEGTTPYVDANGLNIQYGVYEIASYADGFPKAVIPKDKARQLCSGKALKFL